MLGADPLGRGRDGGQIGDVELDARWPPRRCFGGLLSPLQVARPDETVTPFAASLCDLEADPLVGPGTRAMRASFIVLSSFIAVVVIQMPDPHR